MRLRRVARRGTWTGLLLGLVATSVCMPPASGGSSALTTDQSYPVPAGGTFTLHGHGYGHGHGLSQYGAYGAARRGLDYRRIAAFYYPGTSWGKVGGRVRVLITADTTTDLVVSPTPGLDLLDVGSGVHYALPDLDGVTRWRLGVQGTRTVVDYLTSGWHRYRPGHHAALVGDGQLKATGPLTLWTPAGSRTYRGSLRAASPTAGSSARDTVNVVALDAYVQGVVPSEMPTSWPIEAVRSQAVAARTYAAWSRDQRKGQVWQVCDTSACQVYGGVTSETARGTSAVQASARQVLTYGGTAAFAQFSSSSGGWTAAGSRPYLVAKLDPYDGHPANPVHDWTARVSAGSIQKAYSGIGRLRRLRVVRRDGHGQWGGRVLSMVLDGTRKDVTISGDTFRSRFGLRSTWFAG